MRLQVYHLQRNCVINQLHVRLFTTIRDMIHITTVMTPQYSSLLVAPFYITKEVVYRYLPSSICHLKIIIQKLYFLLIETNSKNYISVFVN